MPLPDERPRQSVANLIGRFEKQKSSSGAASTPPTFPRTSSVSSYRTEDSAQEEIKEKREWPPKNVETSTTFLSPPVPGPRRQSLPVSKEMTVPSEPVPPPAPVEAESSTPSVTPAQPMPVKAGSPLPSQTKPTTTHPASPFKSPAKPAVKSSTTTPLKSMAPLKPQDAGQFITSPGPATRKRVSVTPKPPLIATPSRVRTPISAARSMTPSSEARPKTPSSGLYAPTAASLARSKAGAPPPPSIEKTKRKLTTDLSKPTAASASKTRTPAAAPTRGVKTLAGRQVATKPIVKSATGKSTISARQSGITRSLVSKTPVSKTPPAHTKASNAKKAASGVGPAVDAIPAAIAVDSSETAVQNDIETKPEDALSLAPSDVGDGVEIEPEDAAYEPQTREDGSPEEVSYNNGDSHAEEELESYDEDFPDENHHETHDGHENGEIEAVEASSGVFDEVSVVEEANRHHDVESEYTHDTNPHILDEVYNHTEGVEEQRTLSPFTSQDVPADLHKLDDVELHGVKRSTEVSKTNPSIVGTDLEDIVNLLESGVNIHRPSFEASSGSSTVDAGDIPDEY